MNTKQNHNVIVNKVEGGDENQQADITTNVSLTMLTAMQRTK